MYKRPSSLSCVTWPKGTTCIEHHFSQGQISIWRCPLPPRKRLFLIQIFSPPQFTVRCPSAALTHLQGWGSSSTGATTSQLSQVEPSSLEKGLGWSWSLLGTEPQPPHGTWVPRARAREQSSLGSATGTQGFTSDLVSFCCDQGLLSHKIKISQQLATHHQHCWVDEHQPAAKPKALCRPDLNLWDHV